MPIRPENKGLYPPDWDAISLRIRTQRAGNRCERCKAPNREYVARGVGPHAGLYMLVGGETYDAETGEFLGLGKGSEFEADNLVEIVLTVAHLDHDPTNNDESNLKALCQRCHNRYDAEHRRETRRARRDAAKGPMLPGLDA